MYNNVKVKLLCKPKGYTAVMGNVKLLCKLKKLKKFAERG